MKIAICDDEDFCREQAIALTKEYSNQNRDTEISFEAFTHAEELIEANNKNGGYDIYILDIVMPGIDGIALGSMLRDTGYDGKIIYLTSSEEYALDSYKVRAFNYLLKPIDKSKFFAVIDEAVRAMTEKNGKSIIVKSKESSIKLNFDNIMYAVLSRRVISYHLTSGKTVESRQIRSTFPEAVQELSGDNRFVLCGASMIINMYYITEIESDAIIFKSGQKLHLGKKMCRDIRSAWVDFCFSEEGL